MEASSRCRTSTGSWRTPGSATTTSSAWSCCTRCGASRMRRAGVCARRGLTRALAAAGTTVRPRYERHPSNEIAAVVDKMTALGMDSKLVAVRSAEHRGAFSAPAWTLTPFSLMVKPTCARAARRVAQPVRWREPAAGRPVPEQGRVLQGPRVLEEGPQGRPRILLASVAARALG